MFEREQDLFSLSAARIAREIAVCADDAVAGNDDGNGVVPDCGFVHFVKEYIFFWKFSVRVFQFMKKYSIIGAIS